MRFFVGRIANPSHVLCNHRVGNPDGLAANRRSGLALTYETFPCSRTRKSLGGPTSNSPKSCDSGYPRCWSFFRAAPYLSISKPQRQRLLPEP